VQDGVKLVGDDILSIHFLQRLASFFFTLCASKIFIGKILLVLHGGFIGFFVGSKSLTRRGASKYAFMCVLVGCNSWGKWMSTKNAGRKSGIQTHTHKSVFSLLARNTNSIKVARTDLSVEVP
jgi:hypothetical protein